MHEFPLPTRIGTCMRMPLQKAGCEKIFRDVASGVVDSRKGLAEAIEYVRDGDTLVVWKLDRLGRSLKHLIETVNVLAARKIGFQSLRASMVSPCTQIPDSRLLILKSFPVFNCKAIAL